MACLLGSDDVLNAVTSSLNYQTANFQQEGYVVSHDTVSTRHIAPANDFAEVGHMPVQEAGYRCVCMIRQKTAIGWTAWSEKIVYVVDLVPGRYVLE